MKKKIYDTFAKTTPRHTGNRQCGLRANNPIPSVESSTYSILFECNECVCGMNARLVDGSLWWIDLFIGSVCLLYGENVMEKVHNDRKSLIELKS